MKDNDDKDAGVGYKFLAYRIESYEKEPLLARMPDVSCLLCVMLGSQTLTFSLVPVTRICVDFFTVYNDRLVAKGLK